MRECPALLKLCRCHDVIPISIVAKLTELGWGEELEKLEVARLNLYPVPERPPWAKLHEVSQPKDLTDRSEFATG